MADSLDDIKDQLARAIDIEDNDTARKRLETAREELEELREHDDINGDRAKDLETKIDQRLRMVGERGNYETERIGAASDPTDEDAA